MTGKTMNLTSLDPLLSVDTHRITETISNNVISRAITMDISEAIGKEVAAQALNLEDL